MKKTKAPMPPDALVDEVWRGLVVDDDAASRASAKLAIDGECIFGIPIALEFAGSAAQAMEMIKQNPGYCFAILDVVMEHQTAGLELIDWIRGQPACSGMRLAVRTGFAAGFEPDEMIERYDIHDYRDKSDLSRAKLMGLVASLARSWMELQNGMAGEKSMGFVADALATMGQAQTPDSFVSALAHGGQGALGAAAGFKVSTGSHLASGADQVDVVKSSGLPDIQVSYRAFDSWPSQARAVKRLIASAKVAYENLAELKRLEGMAYADMLTGMPNRRRAMQWLEKEHDAKRAYACLIMDVDRFKSINDRFGHESGDKLLKVVGERMQKACAESSGSIRAARLGGDEFFALIKSQGQESALLAAKGWVSKLSGPVHLGLESVEPGFSVGVAWCQGQEPAAALRLADMAMYQAKRSGRGRVCLYEQGGPASSMSSRLERVERLKRGLAAGELEALFQPIVDAKSGSCIAMEAFARWRSSGESLSPQDFLPMAQEVGLSGEIDEWMAAEALKASIAMGVRISINLDGRQVSREFGERHACAAKSGGLCFEIQEASAAAHFEAACNFARTVRQEGQELCIDNWGSGSASIRLLSGLMPNWVKISSSKALSATGDGQALCSSAKALGIEAVATEVENSSQAGILARMGYGALQGMGISPPMPLDQARIWLESNARSNAPEWG